jgi:hypothetical protein
LDNPFLGGSCNRLDWEIRTAVFSLAIRDFLNSFIYKNKSTDKPLVVFRSYTNTTQLAFATRYEALHCWCSLINLWATRISSECNNMPIPVGRSV